ncbi:hypothetical protein B9Z19DRAFT_1071909 [Tuber borchii]|uniref:Uncharacterized protein n=1 Tax=Tuber borchii TaxID=42251 RepID=A0A2T7A7G8_TUBBO|nr:hypothetical protein B9Z19DRAFT_1071909 [Tuber borchii]
MKFPNISQSQAHTKKTTNSLKMPYNHYSRRGRGATRFGDFGRWDAGKWARDSVEHMRDEGRYLYNQVDSDVKWEWSEGGLAASDAELYRLGILYDQEVEVEIASSAGEEISVRSEAGDDWSVLDDGESVTGDWDLISELG